MKRTVRVFVVSACNGAVGSRDPAKEIEIEARHVDGLRETALEQLEAEGLIVRALSFSPEGLIAYVQDLS